jgi:hypothetical protein
LNRHANSESGKFLNKHGESKEKGAHSGSRTVATIRRASDRRDMRFAIAVLFIAIGRLLLKIEGRATFLPDFS